MSKRVAIVAAKRTPLGAFQGKLSSVKATQLGAVAIKGCIDFAKLPPEMVQEVRMGNVLPAGTGQAPARQALLAAGLPVSVPSCTINKVCGSGMRAVMDMENAIRSGQKNCAIAGGMESMSNAPFLLPGARAGYRMNNQKVVDSMVFDGLWDPYSDMHMGHLGELCAKQYGFTREIQDNFASQSVLRAQKAIKEGWFKEEIVPVTVSIKGKDTVVDTDEGPGLLNVTKIPQLKPAFQKGGTITAANASSINDGAGALILVSEDKLKELGLKPLAWIAGHNVHAQEPQWFTTAPPFACKKVLDKLNLKPSDIDLWEINEAFAVVSLACMAELSIPHEIVNINGGACALGHPIGCSGVRILVTLLHLLKRHNKRRGCATVCIGGGEATAIVIENADLC
jgi:acetyl-CoA C-acetyltransferase